MSAVTKHRVGGGSRAEELGEDGVGEQRDRDQEDGRGQYVHGAVRHPTGEAEDHARCQHDQQPDHHRRYMVIRPSMRSTVGDHAADAGPSLHGSSLGLV